MKTKKKNRGITALKARYGWICVAPWALGLVLFFIWPVIQSVVYSFCKVNLSNGGMSIRFLGLDNFKYIFTQNANYLDFMVESLVKFLYSFPVILVLSLILALILNQRFRGRLFFRALYFLPVIIASGAVLKTILSSTAAGVSNMQQDESIAMSMFSVSELVTSLGLPQQMSGYFVTLMDGITGLIWSCGVQTVLFIAGLQAIPPLLYEVSRVEGATAWEEFWFIVFPMLSRVLVLVSVFTMVELMTDPTNKIMDQAYAFMRSQFYGESSAMLWSYFLIVGTLMAVLLVLFKKCCLDKWE